MEQTKRFSQGLTRYLLLVEGKYDWIPVIHFIYWDKERKAVCDNRAHITGPHEVEEWIRLKKKEIREGCLTFGLDSNPDHKLQCEVEVKNKPITDILLLVYIGKEIKAEDKKIQFPARAIIYKQKGLNLSHLKKMLDWENERSKSLDTIREMDKPFVFHQAIKEKYEKTRKAFFYLFKR